MTARLSLLLLPVLLLLGARGASAQFVPSPYSLPAPSSAVAPLNPPAVVGADGTYLGRLSPNPVDPDSIANPVGRFGSPVSPTSINNPVGKYGSPVSPYSARNPIAAKPPFVVGEVGGRATVGRLTTNPLVLPLPTAVGPLAPSVVPPLAPLSPIPLVPAF